MTWPLCQRQERLAKYSSALRYSKGLASRQQRLCLRGLPPSQVLAEGQKSADVKHNGSLPPPFRQLKELAERVEFPEKKATVCQFRASFGGRGQISRENAGSLPASPRGSCHLATPLGNGCTS